MKRRDFLSTVAAVPASASLPAPQTPRPAAPAVRQGLKLGTVTYNIAKDWDVPTIIKNLTGPGSTASSCGPRTSKAWRSRCAGSARGSAQAVRRTRR